MPNRFLIIPDYNKFEYDGEIWDGESVESVRSERSGSDSEAANSEFSKGKAERSICK